MKSDSALPVTYFVLAIFAIVGDACAADWPTFMGNAERTGHVAPTTAPAAGRRVWRFSDAGAQAGFAASPAVAEGRVYAGCDNKNLYCLDANTGRMLWKFQAANEVFASPVVVDGRVYLGEGLHESADSKLYCLDAATGRKLWHFQTRSHVEFSPTVVEGKIYFGAGDDGLYCLDAKTGEMIWRYREVHVDMCPAVAGGRVLFGNVYGQNAFFCLDAASGKLVWKTPAPQEVCGSPSTDGERVYFGMGNGSFVMSHAKPVGAVCCLSVAEGKVQWLFRAKDTVLTSVALEGGSAYFGSRDGNLYCVDKGNGKLRWAAAVGQPILSSPAVVGGRVYFGCDDGVVYCVDGRDGKKVWSYDTSNEAFNTDVRILSAPAIDGGRIYIGAMNYHVLCLE